jgi:hypothetical protein
VSETVNAIAREQIERRAYELYVQSGYIQGRDEQNWLVAEEQLRSERGNNVVTMPKPRATQRKAAPRRSKAAINNN